MHCCLANAAPSNIIPPPTQHYSCDCTAADNAADVGNLPVLQLLLLRCPTMGETEAIGSLLYLAVRG